MNEIKHSYCLFIFSITRFEAQTSCKELALVYNDLHKIQLIEGPEEVCHLFSLMTALSSLNLSEAASSRIKPIEMIDIYVNVTLRIKASVPNLLQPIQRYYLGLAKLWSTNSCDTVPKRLQWIFTTYGFKFFLSRKFTKEVQESSIPFSSIGNNVDPLALQLKVVSIWKIISFLIYFFVFRFIGNIY